MRMDKITKQSHWKAMTAACIKSYNMLATQSPAEAASLFLNNTRLLAKMHLAISNVGSLFDTRH